MSESENKSSGNTSDTSDTKRHSITLIFCKNSVKLPQIPIYLERKNDRYLLLYFNEHDKNKREIPVSRCTYLYKLLKLNKSGSQIIIDQDYDMFIHFFYATRFSDLYPTRISPNYSDVDDLEKIKFLSFFGDKHRADLVISEKAKMYATKILDLKDWILIVKAKVEYKKRMKQFLKSDIFPDYFDVVRDTNSRVIEIHDGIPIDDSVSEFYYYYHKNEQERIYEKFY